MKHLKLKNRIKNKQITDLISFTGWVEWKDLRGKLKSTIVYGVSIIKYKTVHSNLQNVISKKYQIISLN